MFQVTSKLKILKHKLLNKKEYSDISLRVIEAKDALDKCKIRLDSVILPMNSSGTMRSV